MSVFMDKQGHAYWCGQGIGGLEKVMNVSFFQFTYLLYIQQTAILPTKLNFPERLQSVSIGDDHMIIQTRWIILHSN